MTGREKRALRDAFIKLLSAAVVAAGLAGMYGMRAGAVQAPANRTAFQAEAEAVEKTEPGQQTGQQGKVIISQFYGAGGGEGVFSNDFVELYNSGDEAVRLDDYILGYSSGAVEDEAGSTVDSDGVRTERTVGLAGSIPAHGYYLVCGAGNVQEDRAYQIESFNRMWQDLVIDDQPTVTLKLYEGANLVDMVSTEGSSCQYLVSASTSVVNGEAARGESGRSGKGLRTFYWDGRVAPEYENLYEPHSSYGAADGEEG